MQALRWRRIWATTARSSAACALAVRALRTHFRVTRFAKQLLRPLRSPAYAADRLAAELGWLHSALGRR